MNRPVPRSARTISPALALLLLAGTARAQSGFTFQWLCDNNWTDICPTTIACPNPRTAWNTNWENANCSGDGRRPTLADDVIIAPMDASRYQVNLGSDALCNTLTTMPGSVLVIDGANLMLGSAGSIGGSLAWGNGQISTGGATVPVMISGDVTMYAPYNHAISYLMVDSYGTVTWTGGTWILSLNSAWTNHGTLDLVGTLTGTGAGGTLYNAGTIVRSSGTGVAYLSMPVNNSGLVSVPVGTVRINDGTSSGTFDTAAGASTEFYWHTFTGSASFTGDGYARIVYGAVHMNGAVTADNFEIAGGSLSGTGSLSVGTSLLWTSGDVRDMADLRMLGGSTNTWALPAGDHWFQTSTINLDDASQTHWTAGSVASRGATINAAAGSEFYADSPGVVFVSDSAFNAGGTVYKTTAGTTEIGMAFNNTGDVRVNAGKLLLNSISGAAGNGSWNVAAGATLGIKTTNYSVATAHVMGPGTSFSGDGVVSFEGGRCHIDEDVTIQNAAISGNTSLAGTGNITIGSSLHWAVCTVEGTSGTPDLTIAEGATLTADPGSRVLLTDRRLVNRGTVLWADPTSGLTISSGTGSIENYGVWDFAGNGGIQGGAGGAGFLNAEGAELVKSAGTGSTMIGTPTLSNDGTIRVQSGKLMVYLTTLTQGQTGSVVLENGAELYFGGAYFHTGPGALLGTGVVTAPQVFNSGLVSPGMGAATGQLDLSGLYIQQAGSVLEIGIGAGGMTDYSRVVAGNTVTIDGGTLVVNEAGYTPVAGETFEVLTGTSRTGAFAAPWFRSVQFPKYKYIYTYTPTSVGLLVSCPADFNGDGYVNGDDADAYNAEFDSGTAAADFNGDGFTTGDDFDEFSIAFEAGC